MPNIILTEYCNLKCPYCFANKMIDNATDCKNITIEQLQQILLWLMPTAITRDFKIGLIGGEPTLHPQFNEILNIINHFCSRTNSHSIIFTNGLKINNFIHLIGEKMSILVNVNKLDKKKNDQLIHNLYIINKLKWFANKKVTLGCNLYLEETNYQYFWDIVNLFPDIQIVRMSVCAPNSTELINDKDKYYQKMKPVFISFLLEAKKRNIKVSYDCNQIPLCYFTEEEKELISLLGDRTDFCDPVIDITPDFKATCCFGTYYPIECNKYNNLDELIRYFKMLMCLKTLSNDNGKCDTCEKIKLGQCQGGCLSFSKWSINNN